MRRQIIEKWNFTPASRTISFDDYLSLNLRRILGITNVTRGVVIYNPANILLGGTISGTTLTLTYNTTSHSSADELLIYYESGQEQQKVLNSALATVSYCTITNAGTTAYGTGATIAFTGGTGTAATAVAVFDSAGFLVGIRLLTFGAYTVAPTGVTITPVSTGAGATATVTAGMFNRIRVDGESSVYSNIFGTFVGTVTYEATSDGMNFKAVNAVPQTGGNIGTTDTAAIDRFIPSQGMKYVQVRCSAYTSGGIISLLNTSANPAVLNLQNALPPGGNSIGSIANFATAFAYADSIAPSNTTSTHAIQYNYNGTTLDRVRNNNIVTVQASAAITTTTNGSAQTNYNARGVLVCVNISAVSGTTPTYDFKLQMQDSVSTNWIDIPGASLTQKTATGQFYLVIYPGVAVTANQSINFIVPRNLRVVEAISGTTPSFTRTIMFNYLL